jgi:riboflavin synthase
VSSKRAADRALANVTGLRQSIQASTRMRSMFTGIVEETGRVVSVETRAEIVSVQVQPGPIVGALPQGASIAIDGCCLTAVSQSDAGFVVELTPETLRRTAFGEKLKPGARVNLERPLRADGRFDGHIVQGHVDGVGRVVALRRLGESAELDLECPQELARYLVHKGSICVDGVSLTVAALSGTAFSIALIPYTLDATTLGERRAGDPVNLETDVIAKYVERLLGPHRA